MEYMLGSSESVKKIVSQITQVASSDFSIIIQGETGSGKSIVAALIHSLSKRHKRPFVTVDIGAIAETLVESELFGHGKGAFTGADKNTRGYFEMANNGTVFLDELQNMTLGMQSKLLGAVEQGKICPVGKTEPVDIDIRIISATNADLRELVKEKKFREDLFFRLSEFVIKLPPLRERIDDIPSFATRFCIEACSELNRPVVELSEEVINLLVRHDWPGNVRELKNVIRRAVLLCEGKTMLPEHVDFLTDGSFEYGEHAPGLTLREISSTAAGEAEKAAIKRVLELTKGNKSRAASILHVNYKTLLSKIKQYSID
jgi:transcriptional regulator with PAS, ATPase and Fis domain